MYIYICKYGYGYIIWWICVYKYKYIYIYLICVFFLYVYPYVWYFPKQLVCWSSSALCRLGSCHEMILPYLTVSPTVSPSALWDLVTTWLQTCPPPCFPLYLPLCLSHCLLVSVRTCDDMDAALSPTLFSTLSPTLSPSALWDLVTTCNWLRVLLLSSISFLTVSSSCSPTWFFINRNQRNRNQRNLCTGRRDDLCCLGSMLVFFLIIFDLCLHTVDIELPNMCSIWWEWIYVKHDMRISGEEYISIPRFGHFEPHRVQFLLLCRRCKSV